MRHNVHNTVQNRKINVQRTVISMYMPEETEKSKRINVRVPIELYSQVVQSYGITEAVILGLHKLLEKPEGTNISPEENKTNGNLTTSLTNRIESLEEQLKVKDIQIEKLTKTPQAQAVQVQTMIQQRAIEAPGAKKPWWQFW